MLPKHDILPKYSHVVWNRVRIFVVTLAIYLSLSLFYHYGEDLHAFRVCRVNGPAHLSQCGRERKRKEEEQQSN